MHIKDILAPDNVVSFARPPDKASLLRELSARAARTLGLEPSNVANAIARREDLGSTGLGAGIAIPHARLAGVRTAVGLLAKLERPIDFESVDGRPVDIVFLLLLPVAPSGEQLATLACVTRTLRDETTAAAIRSATSPDELYRSMIR